MTEQDGADADTSGDPDASGAEGESVDGTALEEIAEEPAGDADDALEAIAADAIDVEGALDAVDADGSALPVAPDDLDAGEDVLARIETAEPEAIAAVVASLQARVATREAEVADLHDEIDDLESRVARKQADFQNYKKRQQKRLEEEKQRATEDLVGRLLDVRDNLRRALDQEEGADIRGGVESTLRAFDEELDRENVEVIEPEPGVETDPQRHEVLMRVESDRPADTVADLHRPGYEMAGKVLRPAQVTVSDGSGVGAESDGEDDADAGGEEAGDGDEA